MKSSLTLILFCLMLFLGSCSTSEIKQSNQIFLNLELQTSDKNKEIILEHILDQNIVFSINFNIKESYELNDNILISDLKYFCNSLIHDQNIYLESIIFDSSKVKDNVLVIYSEEFTKEAEYLKNKYPDELYFLINKKNYENEIIKILGVKKSIDRYSEVSNLDKKLKINHSPRIRNDISKIYFLLEYDSGKSIVPLIRNYALKIDAFSSSQIFHGANSFKKLTDFEDIYIPLSYQMLNEIKEKTTIKSIEYEFEKLLIKDFLLVETIYQNNLFKRNIALKTSSEQVEKNRCIDRNFSISKISFE